MPKVIDPKTRTKIRKRIIRLLNKGYRQVDIAKKLNNHQSTVSLLVVDIVKNGEVPELIKYHIGDNFCAKASYDRKNVHELLVKGLNVREISGITKLTRGYIGKLRMDLIKHNILSSDDPRQYFIKKQLQGSVQDIFVLKYLKIGVPLFLIACYSDIEYQDALQSAVKLKRDGLIDGWVRKSEYIDNIVFDYNELGLKTTDIRKDHGFSAKTISRSIKRQTLKGCDLTNFGAKEKNELFVRVRDLILAGESVKAVAKGLGKTVHQINYVIEKGPTPSLGLDLNPDLKFGKSKFRQREVYRLSDLGYSVKNIAEELGITKTTVYKKLRERGIK